MEYLAANCLNELKNLLIIHNSEFLPNKEAIVENYFNYIQDEIEIQIESIKTAIDIASEQFVEDMRKKFLKKNCILKLNESFFKENIKSVGLMYWSKQPKIESLQKENSTADVRAKFKRIVKDGMAVDCVFYFKSLCVLKDKFILLASYKDNEILMFDLEFNFKSSFSDIDDVIIHRPCSICTNDSSSIVYWVNFGTQELLIVD